MAKDPVCNMMVDMGAAQWTSEHEGQTYYFCAPGCKQAFDANPTKYISGEGSHEGHHGDMHH